MDGTTTPRPGGEDEAIARLRAADPAAGVEPDDVSLAARTSELRADDGDELAQRRARRRPWAAVAAVAAGALVLGGAGFGLGRATTPGDTVAAGDTGAASTAVEQQARTAESLAAADMAIAPAFGGRMIFSADGLPDAAGTAHAWALDAAGGFTAETVVRAAAVLGVEGDPVEEQGMWRVGPLDGSAPSLTLSADGSLSIGYTDPALYPHFDTGVSDGSGTSDGDAEILEESLARQGAAADPGPASSDVEADAPAAPPAEGGGVAPAPAGSAEPAPPAGTAPAVPDGTVTSGPVDPGVPVPEPVEPPGPAPEPEPGPEPAPAGPEADDAVAALRATLAELGLDADAAEYETQAVWEGSAVTSVVAHQVLGGMRTGLTWNADVVAGDVLSFYGPLAPVVELGEYDVVSPAQAVARLNDPRFGATSTGFGIAETPAVGEGWTWGDPPEAPPAAGSALPWRVTEVTIGGAEATLMPHTTDGGATLLVPAYTLTSVDGGEWIVLALADHELAF